MKPFDKLTRLGQIRRLRQLVLKAIEDYDLRVEQVSFLTTDTNTMFRVRSRDGRQFVLRIYSEGETTLHDNQAEMFWLERINQDTDLKVTEPIARRDGEYISVISVPGVPGERRCALFNWIPGKPLEQYLSSATYNKFGETSARLHDHAWTLKPLPRSILPKKWDKVFYYPDEPVVYKAPQYAHLFPPDRIRLLEKVIERAEGVFARLFADKGGQILIHGDLHYWNVHLYRGQLYVIDFEDISVGYPVQDLAITLYYGRQREGYEEWKAAFKQGYSSIRKWPEENDWTIETLMAARSVMFINYVARIDSSPADYIDTRCAELEQYLSRHG